MIVFPNCKINLGLRVLRKRADGYHDLETLFYPLPLYDALEILPINDDTDHLIASGTSVTSSAEDNICLKALKLLKADYAAKVPSLQIYLHKAIPAGAGLGGGSSDAAFLLAMINTQYQLNIPAERLAEYASKLGSDCAFFLLNTPAIGTGRGDLLEPVTLDLSAYKIILVNPGIHISTATAFAGIRPQLPAVSIKNIIALPIREWKDRLVNDFESPVFAIYPDIKKIKEQLYEAGAVYAAMSGSGSSVFGLFPADTPLSLQWPAHYFIRELGSQLQ